MDNGQFGYSALPDFSGLFDPMTGALLESFAEHTGNNAFYPFDGPDLTTGGPFDGQPAMVPIENPGDNAFRPFDALSDPMIINPLDLDFLDFLGQPSVVAEQG
jgi:hypothetical protein